jgi:hypothetical protein
MIRYFFYLEISMRKSPIISIKYVFIDILVFLTLALVCSFLGRLKETACGICLAMTIMILVV